jgi:hypothetical protein
MWRPYFKAESFLRKWESVFLKQRLVFLNRIILAKRKARISLVVNVFLKITILAKWGVSISHVDTVFLSRTILAKWRAPIYHVGTYSFKQTHSCKIESFLYSLTFIRIVQEMSIFCSVQWKIQTRMLTPLKKSSVTRHNKTYSRSTVMYSVLWTIRILVTYLKIIATKNVHGCGFVEGVFRQEKCLTRWHFLRPISKMPRRPKLVSNQQPDAHLWVLNDRARTLLCFMNRKRVLAINKTSFLSTWC